MGGLARGSPCRARAVPDGPPAGPAGQAATLFVNKAAIEGERHGLLTWGAAQAGVAAGVAAAVAEGLIPAADVDDLLCVAAVWVAPGAADEEAVFANNRAATLGAIHAAVSGEPRIEAVLAAADAPANPFFRRSAAGG